MLEKFRTYCLSLRIKSALKGSKIVRKITQYSRARNIGILFNSQLDVKQATVINHMMKKLREEGKNVKAITYFEQERSNPFDFKFDFFTKKDINLLGKITSDAVNVFVHTEFDYLFCLNTTSFMPFESILAESKARFRVGFYDEENPAYFELMLNPQEGEELANLVEQLFHYTKRVSESETSS